MNIDGLVVDGVQVPPSVGQRLEAEPGWSRRVEVDDLVLGVDGGVWTAPLSCGQQFQHTNFGGRGLEGWEAQAREAYRGGGRHLFRLGKQSCGF